jgi:hypothetical protein
MSPSPPVRTVSRTLFLLAGLCLLGIGVAGVFLPVMPGTVFLILSAACFARSSRRLEEWLVRHPRLGPPISAWRRHRAISRPAKAAALAGMAVSLVAVTVSHPPLPALATVWAAICASAVYVASRPDGPRA